MIYVVPAIGEHRTPTHLPHETWVLTRPGNLPIEARPTNPSLNSSTKLVPISEPPRNETVPVLYRVNPLSRKETTVNGAACPGVHSVRT